MNDSKTTDRRLPGRPRGFDRDAAIMRAAAVFWAKGYEGASFRDLTEAMGISPPSLCAAFGDKRGLFLEAVDRYSSEGGQAVGVALWATGRLACDLRAAFGAIIDRASGAAGPSGCLVACVLSDAAETDPACRQRLAAFVSTLDAALIDRFTTAGFVEAEAIARGGLAAAMMHSMALRARAGAQAAELARLADAAVAVLARPCDTDAEGA